MFQPTNSPISINKYLERYKLQTPHYVIFHFQFGRGTVQISIPNYTEIKSRTVGELTCLDKHCIPLYSVLK